MPLTPIVLFVYNRPWHTAQVLNALNENIYADDSILYIYADGPKVGANNEILNNINIVRDIIKSKQWCKEIVIRESNINHGLANSIISGVSDVVSEHGKVIVLEDDLVTSKYFLKYMNEALMLYENEDEVISIMGYLHPVIGSVPETFFLKGADCWGWATWKRGWDLFERDGLKLLKNLKNKRLCRQFDFDGAYPYVDMLLDQINKKNDSWAIRWKAAAFIHNKLSLYPGTSLVKNIGHDGSGLHCDITDIFDVQLSTKSISIIKIPISQNKNMHKRYIEYYKKLYPLKIKVKSYFSKYVKVFGLVFLLNIYKSIAMRNNHLRGK